MPKPSLPKGFRPSHGRDRRPRVAVVFDDELFDQIRAFAQREHKGFSAAVGELCRVGLLDLAESDQLEPAA